MNLYLVSRTDEVDYDEFDSFVIATNTAEEARSTLPKWSDDPEWRCSVEYGWTMPEHVQVRFIGVAHQGIEHGEIICASFNAG